MAVADYKTILASVRPQRAAVFIDRADPDWRETCLRIIEFYTTLWGGGYNIIVPTDGTTISKTFWKILETFDPDYLFRYWKSRLDLKLAKPDEYNDIVDRYAEKFIADSPGVDRDECRGIIDEQLQKEPFSNFAMSTELQSQLKCRLAPFYYEEWIVRGGEIGAQLEVRFPLTALSKILPHTDHVNEIADVSATEVPPLWYSAVTGRIHERYAAALQEIGLRTVTRTFSGRLWDLVVKGRSDMLDEGAILPFNLSMIQLGRYRSSKYRQWEEPAVVVVGESLDDFCLYFCLSRLRENVCWLPPTWLDAFRTARESARAGGDLMRVDEQPAIRFANALLGLTRDLYGRRRVRFISASLEQEDLERARADLDAALMFDPGCLENLIDIKDSLEGLLHFPLVTYENGNVGRDVTKQFIDNELPGLFETPKPKNFRKIDPREHRWITELTFKNHQLPCHSSLGTYVIRDKRLGTSEARTGRNGIAYFCPNVAYFGGDIDSILVKPSLRLPDAFQVFRRVSDEAGLTCKISDKGFYAQETIRKFKNLGNVAEFYRHEQKRSLLEKFLDTTEPGKGVHGEGVFLNSDQRRYLNFASIKKLLGDQEEPGALIDELIRAGVFYRGFIFKCGFCRNADWFLIDEVTQEFKCKRCGRQQIYAKEHWLEPPEPGWFYKLNEIVYQGLRNCMIFPMLALDCLRSKAPESFLYTNELEIWEPDGKKPLLEVDICCIPEGVLTIGEVKKENRLGPKPSDEDRSISNYRHLAKKIGARRVVFATADSSWSETTKNKIELAFQGTHLDLTLLTGNDLFGA